MAAGILLAVQLWWLALAPPGATSEQTGAVLLLAPFLVFFLLGLRVKHALVRIPAVALAISFLGLHIIFDILYLPVIEDIARFHGTTYVLTRNPEFLGWGIPYRQFVEWKNPVQPEVQNLGYESRALKITYDAENKVVSLVDSRLNDLLLYSDDGTFRRYQGYVQVGRDRYYASAQCNTMDRDWCVTTVYSLFRCRQDNTSCVLLPITYTGEDGYVTLQVNESSGAVDFYLTPNSTTTDTNILIYSYGQALRCYVTGCSIRP